MCENFPRTFNNNWQCFRLNEQADWMSGYHNKLNKVMQPTVLFRSSVLTSQLNETLINYCNALLLNNATCIQARGLYG